MISSLVLGIETLEELSLFLYNNNLLLLVLVVVASFLAVPPCIFLITTIVHEKISTVFQTHPSLQQETDSSLVKTSHGGPTQCDLNLLLPQVRSSKKGLGNYHHPRPLPEYHAVIERKRTFLNSKHGKGYGYSSTPKGHIDLWRDKEFPTLIRPIPWLHLHGQEDKDTTITTAAKEEKREKVDMFSTANPDDPVDNGMEVYLDYAGSAIPTKSLLEAMHCDSIQNQILGNPHSNGPSSSRTQESIEQIKKQVLDFFDAHAGPMYGFSHDAVNVEKKKEEEYHPGYDVIFTSGTTHALQIVGENFDWDDGSGGGTMDENKRSMLVYSHNAHTSVIGMREPAIQRGASFRCEKMDDIARAGTNEFDTWGDLSCYGETSPWNGNDDGTTTATKNNTTNVKHLLVFPLECNFGGEKSDARSIIQTSRGATKNGKWYTLLDIAKAASTQHICLRRLDPDFACVSFYKIFGAPTGIGALLVKRSSKGTLLNSRWNGNGIRRKRQYFGGGSVDIALPGKDFMRPRSSPSSLDSLVHGTVNFRTILSLRSCFQEMKQIGGLEEVSKHTQSLLFECVSRLQNLRHPNGRPIVKLYGPWSCHHNGRPKKDVLHGPLQQGSAIAFNIQRSDGTYVGYNEVSKLAALYKTPIQLRTGCFCNPGACHEALKIAEEHAEDYYYKSGKVCGDHLDVIDGVPTGAVRISIGKDSIWEDIDVAVNFLEKTFKDKALSVSEIYKKTSVDENQCSAVDQLRLTNIYIFPIKSCGAMEVDQWEMNIDTGNLLYDREFALVDVSGTALRLCRYPKMGSIRPHIDPEKKTLSVSAPSCPTLVINLDADLHHPMTDIKVCGNKCDGKLWGSYAVSSWFSDYLGVRCWLARANTNAQNQILKHVDVETRLLPKARVGFENEAPLLLLSTNSVDILNNQLRLRGSCEVNAKFFRPNLVVEIEKTCGNTNPEDRWATVTIPRSVTELEVTGQCARCSMVDVDPDSGMKGKTLSALAEYRRNNGQITFGIFLKIKNKYHDNGDSSIWIKKGDILEAKRLC